MRKIVKDHGDIIGLDLSLVATGIATPSSIQTLTTKGYTDTDRMIYLRDTVMDIVRGARLVVVEGFAYNKSNKAHEIGGLGWVVRVAMAEEEVPYIDIAPTKLKVFGTGKGNASKTEMVVAATKRLNTTPKDDNQADAAWLRELGLHLIGQPTIELPQTHLRALEDL